MGRQSKHGGGGRCRNPFQSAGGSDEQRREDLSRVYKAIAPDRSRETSLSLRFNFP